MTIPTIDSYIMPRSNELPKSRTSWKLDPDRTVLLIHDMQQYFIDYYDVKKSPVVDLVANIRLLREQCAHSAIPVVYTMQPAQQTPEQRGLLLDLWGPGLTEHPQKQAILKELSPGDADVVLRKWRYSAFQKTELLNLLRRWNRDQIIICGVYAHIGCMLTACDAFMNDIQPFFISDATSDFSSDLHTMAIAYVSQRCGVALSTRDVLNAICVSSRTSSSHEVTDNLPTLLGPRDQVLSLERLRIEVSDLLQQPLSEVTDREDLLDLGLDSIRLMTLVEQLRNAGVDITFVELAEHPTLASWWKLLSSRSPYRSRQMSEATSFEP